MKSKNWINRQKNDQFVIKSKQKGFLSRSAFKLIEIETKFNFIKYSKKIIDLGAAPGGWCQVIFQFNPNANVTAVDSLNLKFFHSNIDFIKKDFTKIDFKYLNKKYDLILSDLAPNTTGHQSTDHLRLSNIVNNVIEKFEVSLILSKISSELLGFNTTPFSISCFFKLVRRVPSLMS